MEEEATALVKNKYNRQSIYCDAFNKKWINIDAKDKAYDKAMMKLQQWKDMAT